MAPDTAYGPPVVPREEIIAYYETCDNAYRQVWDLNTSFAMHYGYWDASTRSLREALRRENEVLATRAHIRPEDHVLDAGCGVGGSSLFLAETIGCTIQGITLSPKQVAEARAAAQEKGVQARVQFSAQDYLQTNFADASFDVVWAIESVCHAPVKRDFLAEAFRVLRPGGRLIIADFFAGKPHYTEQEWHTMRRWTRGWASNDLARPDDFAADAASVGFTATDFTDCTAHIVPSAKRLYRLSFLAVPYVQLLRMVGLLNRQQAAHGVASYYQYFAIRDRLTQYGLFYAEKPAP